MPDRAIIPLLAAGMGGFIAGTIVAVTQTFKGVWLIGLIVGLLVAAAAYTSIVGVEGDPAERRIVGALRAAVAAACFGFLYGGLVKALRDGSMVGIIFLLCAGFFAVLLTRFRVRDRGELQPS